MRASVLMSVICLTGLVLCAGCSSSDSSDPVSPGQLSFEGAWGLESIEPESGIRVYAKLGELSGNQDGYQFEQDGSLLVRNAGWCGTPPLTYSNFEGSWLEEEYNCLVLEYPHWEEAQNFRMEILSVLGDEMRCRVGVIE